MTWVYMVYMTLKKEFIRHRPRRPRPIRAPPLTRGPLRPRPTPPPWGPWSPPGPPTAPPCSPSALPPRHRGDRPSRGPGDHLSGLTVAYIACINRGVNRLQPAAVPSCSPSGNACRSVLTPLPTPTRAHTETHRTHPAGAKERQLKTHSKFAPTSNPLPNVLAQMYMLESPFPNVLARQTAQGNRGYCSQVTRGPAPGNRRSRASLRGGEGEESGLGSLNSASLCRLGCGTLHYGRTLYPL